MSIRFQSSYLFEFHDARLVELKLIFIPREEIKCLRIPTSRLTEKWTEFVGCTIHYYSHTTIIHYHFNTGDRFNISFQYALYEFREISTIDLTIVKYQRIFSLKHIFQQIGLSNDDYLKMLTSEIIFPAIQTSLGKFNKLLGNIAATFKLNQIKFSLTSVIAECANDFFQIEYNIISDSIFCSIYNGEHLHCNKLIDDIINLISQNF